MQPSFLDDLPRKCDWRPPELKPLPPGVKHVAFDTETDGLAWWEADRPVGLSICPFDPEGWRGESLYYPWDQRGGGNLPKERVLEWAKGELRNKHLHGLNTRFDNHMLFQENVDLEKQGCQLNDVGHLAALLDDNRKRFNLDDLVQHFLGKEKVGKELDDKRMASYHAGEVAPRAMADAEQTAELYQVMWPEIVKEDLTRVSQLEDEVIYAVCEMERNGVPIDTAKAEQWDQETAKEYEDNLYRLFKDVGYKDSVSSNKGLSKLFLQLGIPIALGASGNASYTDEILETIDNPHIKRVRRARHLKQLRSKYLKVFRDGLDSNGIFRYALHQLRTTKDDRGPDDVVGTISGRFSSTEILKGIGSNIQQIFKAEKQAARFSGKYTIRELFIPASGYWLAADASQIEYRLFAHYANNPKIIARYEEDPEYSFHKMIHEMLLPFLPDLTYKRAKDVNFANIYGAGLLKMAWMLKFISEAEYLELRDSRNYSSHKLDAAKEIKKIYRRELPEAYDLIQKTSSVAENRGYVKTFLGRRARFEEEKRFHKALNSIVQGGAADINKRKLVELHKAREWTQFTMRFTVHDEVDGDVPSLEHANRVKEILNDQSYNFRVPILWDVETGSSWAEAA